MKDVSDGDFDREVIARSNSIPVIVDFWAEWCGPCIVLKPILEELSEEYDGKLELAKINVDDSPAVSKRFGISSIPSVKLFIKGKVAAEFTGALPEDAVRQWLQRNID